MSGVYTRLVSMVFSLLPSAKPAHEASPPAIVTVLNDAFVEYFRVLLFSIRKHNPGFDLPVVILHSRTLSPLSLSQRDQLLSVHANIDFLEVDESPYTSFFPVTPPRLHPALLKLEIFAARGYERLLFLDADMLCLGDLRELFALSVPFAACPAGKDRAKKERLRNDFHRRRGFNTGVMMIGKDHLDGRTYTKLLRQRLAPCPTADQDILNRFFRWKKVYCLDHRYNYHAQFFWKGDETDVKILHYAGAKPLEAPKEDRMKVWFAYREEMGRCHGSTVSP